MAKSIYEVAEGLKLLGTYVGTKRETVKIVDGCLLVGGIEREEEIAIQDRGRLKKLGWEFGHEGWWIHL